LLLQRVEKFIRANGLLSTDDTIVVAVSGGADSIALLHILCDISIVLHLHVVYIDHGLRPLETGEERRFIADLCSKKGLPFESTIVDPLKYQQDTKSSLEEAARILRYKALHLIRKKIAAKHIAVGHTADDQVEEFLLRMIRGTGRNGLAGMSMLSDNIVRPLLEESKSTLLSYLTEQNIPHCEDSSNQQRVFLRNRVRLDLLPFLEKNFNNSIRTNLLQIQDILRQEEELLDSITEKKIDTIVSYSHSSKCTVKSSQTANIKISSFLECHKALQRRILEKVCWKMSTPPTFRQIQQLIHIMETGQEAAEVHLSKGLRIKRKGDVLYFSHPDGIRSYRGKAPEDTFSIHKKIPSTGKFTFDEIGMTLRVTLQEATDTHIKESKPDILNLDASNIHFPLLLRAPKPGEKFSPLGMKGKKKITRYLSDKKIPQEERHLYPVLLSQSQVIAILGLQIDNDYKVISATNITMSLKWSRS
jgi:tRNA(Ile)-lysidine synthase